MSRNRLEPDQRKQDILDAAMLLSIENNYATITKQQIADKCDISPSLINTYFNDMDGMRQAIMKEAIHLSVSSIIAQGVVYGNGLAINANANMLRKAGDWVANGGDE